MNSKDSTVSFESLDSAITEKVTAFQESLTPEKLRTQKASPCIHRNSESQSVVGIGYLSKRWRFLLLYVVLVHYYHFDEKHYAYCRLDLEEHFESNSQFYWMKILIESKNYFLKWLSCQSYFNLSTFFGRYLTEEYLLEVAKSIILRFEETFPTPRRTIRRRGYRDKGSLPEPSTSARRHEESIDFSLREIQNQKEAKAELRNSKTQSFKEWCEGFRTLTEEELIEFRLKKTNKTGGNKNDKTAV